jgi:hypothetical protein
MVFNKVALLGALLICSASAVNAEETKTQVLASVSGVTTYGGDPALEQGIKLIFEAQSARDTKLRRENIKTAPQEHVVRTHRDLDGVMILGGSAALPM